MTEREMFEKSFQRPINYRHLSSQKQWDIDSELGILDWIGSDLSPEYLKRMEKYYI